LSLAKLSASAKLSIIIFFSFDLSSTLTEKISSSKIFWLNIYPESPLAALFSNKQRATKI